LLAGFLDGNPELYENKVNIGMDQVQIDKAAQKIGIIYSDL